MAWRKVAKPVDLGLGDLRLRDGWIRVRRFDRLGEPELRHLAQWWIIPALPSSERPGAQLPRLVHRNCGIGNHWRTLAGIRPRPGLRGLRRFRREIELFPHAGEIEQR